MGEDSLLHYPFHKKKYFKCLFPNSEPGFASLTGEFPPMGWVLTEVWTGGYRGAWQSWWPQGNDAKAQTRSCFPCPPLHLLQRGRDVSVPCGSRAVSGPAPELQQLCEPCWQLGLFDLETAELSWAALAWLCPGDAQESHGALLPWACGLCAHGQSPAGVTSVAIGVLSLLKLICGARSSSQGAGGALVGLWDTCLPPGAAGNSVMRVVTVAAGPAGLLSSRAKSVLFLISGAMVSVRGSTTWPAPQQTHPEWGLKGQGGTRAWSENGSEATPPPMAASQKVHEHIVEWFLWAGSGLCWQKEADLISDLLFWLARPWINSLGGNQPQTQQKREKYSLQLSDVSRKISKTFHVNRFIFINIYMYLQQKREKYSLQLLDLSRETSKTFQLNIFMNIYVFIFLYIFIYLYYINYIFVYLLINI